MSESDSTDDDPRMAFDVEVRADRTILTIEAVRDAAVIVRSEAGERIYLPPEEFDTESKTTSPYSTSPYSATSETEDDADADDDMPSPYSKTTDDAPADGPEYGRTRTPQGIRIVHPDPVTDVRIVR
ncbi:DUF7510 family protein [Halapricum desulfuricans]|uniref:Uncharacterized protein n=1 Tax=Halapricum desulfuricans TaxID=2841257 RepID=A0A897NPT6_9EURY|nr:hypothetical protein [Halapricum desulfuricans]QSG14817.1 Uncharacterized protein HSEST_1284 [Halapricum desulfuricans]